MLIFYRNALACSDGRLYKLEHLSHFIQFCLLSVIFEAEKLYSAKSDWCSFPG
jgi:hypothetical protein